MSPMLPALLFAASAAAQLTTSMWMPSSYDPDEVGFYGSVVGVEDGKTTIALVFDDGTNASSIDAYEDRPQTITVSGSAWLEAVTTTADGADGGDVTYSLGCSIPASTSAKPTCTYSVGGELAYQAYCGDYSSYTGVYITTYEVAHRSSTETYTETVIPDFCLSGSTIPESVAVETVTLGQDDVETYQVVITAGEEKLSATAGSTPTGTGAQITGSRNVTSPTGPTANAAAPENTGAAAPMVTRAPMLAGLGVAAMAALVL